MKLRSLAVFGIGYVLGSRAGRERYGQIVEAARRLTDRVEAYSQDHPPPRSHDDPARSP